MKQYREPAESMAPDESPNNSGEFEEVDLGDPRQNDGSSAASSAPKEAAPSCPSTTVTVGNVQTGASYPPPSVTVGVVQIPLATSETKKKTSFLQRLKRFSCKYFAESRVQ